MISAHSDFNLNNCINYHIGIFIVHRIFSLVNYNKNSVFSRFFSYQYLFQFRINSGSLQCPTL